MLKKIINYSLYLFIITPVVFFLILISKIILVRFYVINARIGHLSEDFFLYLCKKKIEKIKKKRTLDIFAIDEEIIIANSEIKKYVKNKTFCINLSLVRPFFFYLKIISKKIKFLKKHLAYERKSKKDGYQYFDENVKFEISKNIEDFGQDFLKKKNIDIDKKFVCLNLWTNQHLQNIDSLHHSAREVSIKPYIKTIKYLIKNDFYVFKVGRDNKKTFLDGCSNFFDFSHENFDDRLDLYFLKNCHSIISSQTGLDHLAFALNKPMLINSTYIIDYFIERPNIIYLLRPYLENLTHKKLSIDQIIFDYDLSFKYKSINFEEKDIIVGENNETEILNAYKDLEYLINNNFKNDEVNTKISNLFWEKFLSAKYKHGKNLEYYKKNKILSFYSWSNLKKLNV